MKYRVRIEHSGTELLIIEAADRSEAERIGIKTSVGPADTVVDSVEVEEYEGARPADNEPEVQS